LLVKISSKTSNSELGVKTDLDDKRYEVMKCIWHWKWIADATIKDGEYQKVAYKFEKALKEHPEDFPKLSPGFHTGRGVGFRLVEGNEEQLANLVTIWAPVEEWRLEVYFEAKEDSSFSKAHLKYGA
jgi:hypothetical protein